MPPRMRTRSADRPIAESLGGGTGVRVSRGGRGRRPREEGVNGNVEGANRGAPDFSTIIAQQLQNLLPAMLAQVTNQGNVGNQNGNVVNENVQENVRNVLVNGNREGCSYKEFLACNPKEYDGKGGVIRTLSREVAISMSWNDFKFMMIQDFCPNHEMQKLESELWNHAMVGACHAAYIDRFHELARLVPHLVTPESRMIERYVYGLTPQICGMVAATKPKTMQKAVQISGALTDEVMRNGSIKKVEKRGNMGETSKDKNGRDDNKRTRTGNAFATTVNPIGRENMGTWPKCTTCNSYHALGWPCRTCFNCNLLGHLAKDCRGVPRNVNHVNARNPTVRACYECGSTDHVRSILALRDGMESRCTWTGRGNSSINLSVMLLTGVWVVKTMDSQAIGTRVFLFGPEKLARMSVHCDLAVEPNELGVPKLEIEIAYPPRQTSRHGKKARCDKKQEEIIVVRDFPEDSPDDLYWILPIRELEVTTYELSRHRFLFDLSSWPWGDAEDCACAVGAQKIELRSGIDTSAESCGEDVDSYEFV
ncbi:putative reverse transcriptase domain-containing protein [Tanacetum coccineum]